MDKLFPWLINMINVNISDTANIDNEASVV